MTQMWACLAASLMDCVSINVSLHDMRMNASHVIDSSGAGCVSLDRARRVSDSPEHLDRIERMF